MKKLSFTLSDKELLEAMKKGSHSAFEMLFDKYWERLYAYAYKIYADTKVCEDIVQEVYISLWERKLDLQVSYLEGYLFKAVKYQVVKHVKKLQFTEEQLLVLTDTPFSSSPESILEYSELELQLESQIAQLPSKCKEVFLLSRQEKLTNQEIATQLKLSKRTVETHISNALKILKNKTDGLFYISMALALLV